MKTASAAATDSAMTRRAGERLTAPQRLALDGSAPTGDPIAVVLAERARQVLGQGVAVALSVGGAHEGGDHLEVPLGDVGGLAPEVGEPEVDVELEKVDARGLLGHASRVETGSDDIGCSRG